MVSVRLSSSSPKRATEQGVALLIWENLGRFGRQDALVLDGPAMVLQELQAIRTLPVLIQVGRFWVNDFARDNVGIEQEAQSVLDGPRRDKGY